MIDEPSPAPPSNHQSEFGGQDSDDSEPSTPEVQDESEDADFDIDDSPAPEATDSVRHERSTSVESHRPLKRKLGVEDDEHIKANPELYGLRRSVGAH
jgi:chromodomain-helicase-DNA-binding protein 1